MGWKRYSLFPLSILLILLLLWWAGIGEIQEVLKNANADYLLLAVLVCIVSLITWALRWDVLLKSLGIRSPFKNVLAGLLIGVFVNNVTPGARGGGEPVRMYYISKKTGEPYGHVFATVMMDRVSDVIPVVIMLLLATIHVYYLGSLTLSAVIFLIDFVFAVLLLSLLGIFLSERRTKNLLYWFYRRFKKLMPKKALKYESKFFHAVEVSVPQFQENFRRLLRHRRAFLMALIYSGISWSLIVLRSYFIFLSLNYRIPLMSVLVVQVVGTVLGMMSVVPGGAGITEAINSAVYIFLGIDKELAVTATVLDRLVSYWVPTVIGAVLTAHFGISIEGTAQSESIKNDNDINDDVEGEVHREGSP